MRREAYLRNMRDACLRVWLRAYHWGGTDRLAWVRLERVLLRHASILRAERDLARGWAETLRECPDVSGEPPTVLPWEVGT